LLPPKRPADRWVDLSQEPFILYRGQAL